MDISKKNCVMVVSCGKPLSVWMWLVLLSVTSIFISLWVCLLCVWQSIGVQQVVKTATSIHRLLRHSHQHTYIDY